MGSHGQPAATVAARPDVVTATSRGPLDVGDSGDLVHWNGRAVRGSAAHADAAAIAALWAAAARSVRAAAAAGRGIGTSESVEGKRELCGSYARRHRWPAAGRQPRDGVSWSTRRAGRTHLRTSARKLLRRGSTVDAHAGVTLPDMTTAPLATDPAGTGSLDDPGPRPENSYSAVEASRVLGVSERRVRQIVDDGRLPAVSGDGPLRLPMEAVHAERDRRRRAARAAERSTPYTSPDSAGGTPAPTSAPLDVEDVVTRTVRSLLPLMLEPSERAEAAARSLLAEEHAMRLQAEARAADAEARLRVAEERLHARREAARDAAEVVEVKPNDQAEDLPQRRGWWRRQGV